MTKQLKSHLIAFTALVAGSIGAAQATPYTWTDAYNPTDVKLSSGSVFSYSHDIRDGANGYRPAIDSILGASLTIWLYDDAFFGDIPVLGDVPETVSFSFDGSSWSGAQSVGGNVLFNDTFSFFSLANLLSDGYISVGLRSGATGDFMFDKSFLQVFGDQSTVGEVPATSVPEPGTLLLFGLGLVGVGLATRAKRKRIS